MCLPYWNSELDVEAGAWTYASSARGTLSAARLHSPQLEELSALALALDSELLYLYGKTCGAAGSMLWDEAVLDRREAPELLPFTLVLGWSDAVERLAAGLIERCDGLSAGVTDCTFWNRGVPLARYKVVAFMAALPIFDEESFLTTLSETLKSWVRKDRLIPYYAERFGFVRAPVPYETDSPRRMLMMDELNSFQLDATRSVVGPAPTAPLPMFFELAAMAGSEQDDL